MYLLQEGDASAKQRVQLMGSGTILREVIAAADLLKEFGVTADIWSCPSFTELRRDGMECERFNLLNPTETPRVPFVTQQLQDRAGPIIAATDYMRLFSDQVRPYVPAGRRYITLGTDGFGRSDTRAKQRFAVLRMKARSRCLWSVMPSRSSAFNPTAPVRCPRNRHPNRRTKHGNC
jgi:pyruvate dehydrogenase E1 component